MRTAPIAQRFHDGDKFPTFRVERISGQKVEFHGFVLWAVCEQEDSGAVGNINAAEGCAYELNWRRDDSSLPRRDAEELCSVWLAG